MEGQLCWEIKARLRLREILGWGFPLPLLPPIFSKGDQIDILK